MTSTSIPAWDGVDLFTDMSIVDDPYPFWDYLRSTKGPVWLEPHYGMAVVTGLDEAMEVYRDGELFSSCNSATGPFPGLPQPVDPDDAGPALEAHRHELPMSEFMVAKDGAEHSKYRGLFTGLFTPKRLKENEDFMWRLADEQIDRFIATGRCEFGADYAAPFAALVIADLLGVPTADMERFRAQLGGDAAFAVEDSPQQLQDNPIDFTSDAFENYIQDRRAQPRPDILTHLAQATFADGSLPDVPTVAREASFLFAAGTETTVRLLAFALRHVAEHPDVAEMLRRQRDLIPGFVEEMLRMESPVKAHFRLVRRRTVLGGVELAAGTTVMLLPGAANRDPRSFDAAGTFRLDRKNVREQLAFGRGAHSCIGQPLARSEARITLERMFDRTTDIRIAESEHGSAGERRYRYLPTWLFRGLEAIHLEFDAR